MEEELLKYLDNKVAPYKRLRGGIKFLDAIPKSPSGKILRRILKVEAAKDVEANQAVKAKL